MLAVSFDEYRDSEQNICERYGVESLYFVRRGYKSIKKCCIILGVFYNDSYKFEFYAHLIISIQNGSVENTVRLFENNIVINYDGT